ncbi:AraC family transcriptional regulator [Corynebacterium coyleae]|uniref:AraC family transcriptional regulator n=1 Tax=Corynebacterium coyleae TaxID=53374 RepID=A0AAP7CBF1_9CORY|nr:AraC family transcriptional regulator [Corynebacterium coyleae]
MPQLGRAFTLRFGMPPMRYLAHIRTLRLAHLLVETDLPIGVAMTKVGWRSRKHAARQFTGIVGIRLAEPSAHFEGARSHRDHPVAISNAGQPRIKGPPHDRSAVMPSERISRGLMWCVARSRA